MRITIETRAVDHGHNAIRFRLRRGIDMKLEMDLLRDLLLYVEEKATRPESDLENIDLSGWTADQVAYHVVLAQEDGLIKATIDELPGDGDPEETYIAYTVHRLTSRGHELLGIIREAKHWRLLKQGASKAGVATVGALFSMGQAYLKTLFISE